MLSNSDQACAAALSLLHVRMYAYNRQCTIKQGLRNKCTASGLIPVLRSKHDFTKTAHAIVYNSWTHTSDIRILKVKFALFNSEWLVCTVYLITHKSAQIVRECGGTKNTNQSHQIFCVSNNFIQFLSL